jgi:hypothetical protein
VLVTSVTHVEPVRGSFGAVSLREAAPDDMLVGRRGVTVVVAPNTGGRARTSG